MPLTQPPIAGAPVAEKPVSSGTVRPLRGDDRQPLVRLLRDTGMFTDDEVGIALELIDVVLTKPGQKDYVISVYEDAGEVLGYYCIGPTPGTDGTFDLYWIAVHPEAQGRGIGGVLDGHALELIRSMGGRLVVAETSSQPRYAGTRAFYLGRGYLELSRISGYYRPGDDLVVYGKYLSKQQEGG